MPDHAGHGRVRLVHHWKEGQGHPPLVFVHGFACGGSDWDAQVASLSPRHATVALDLPGHGQTPGWPEDCTIERYAMAVAELVEALDLSSAVLVGHSMGCRVVTEAALQIPERVAGLVLVDGSQSSDLEAPALRAAFARPGGYAAVIENGFRDMFTAESRPDTAEHIMQRAHSVSEPLGTRLLLDICRYDVHRFEASLASLRVPVLAIQSTGRDEHWRRVTLTDGQTTPYLDMLRGILRSVVVEIVPGAGHMVQVDEGAATSAAIARFVSGLASTGQNAAT